MIGIGVRTFERLEQLEVLTPHVAGKRGKAGSYDLAVVVPAYIRHLKEEEPEKPREAKDRSQAELNQLKLDREMRLLLPRELVVSEGQQYISAVTAKLRSLPPRMVQAGLVSAAGGGAVDAMVEETITEMARWQTSLQLLQAVSE